MMNKFRILFLLAAFGAPMISVASAHDPVTGRATAILNEGVIVELGETKILFDPIYDNGFNAFPEMDDALKQAVIEGDAPYDNVDAIFVSHHHGDHFSVPNMLRLLKAQPDVRLIAPTQAVAAMGADDEWEPSLATRITTVALENGDAAKNFSIGDVSIEALRSPHTGWPEHHSTVENITYRIAFADGVHIMHMGDADKAPAHFGPHEEFFAAARTDMAFVPFWFLEGDESAGFIDNKLNVEHAIGIHVPIDLPDSLIEARDKNGADFFSTLGESRDIGATKKH